MPLTVRVCDVRRHRWHWISMRDHLAGHPDEQHTAWRKVHPGLLAPNPNPNPKPDPDHDPNLNSRILTLTLARRTRVRSSVRCRRRR